MTKEARSIRCPEAVLGWIPWYGEDGNDGRGVLSERQRGAVEAHCAECADCRAELDMISGHPFEIDVELPDPDRLFEEVTARIGARESEPASRETASPVIPIGRGRVLRDEDYEKLANWIFDESVEAEFEASVDEIPQADAVGGRRAEGPGRVIQGPFGAAPTWAAAAAAVLLLGLGGAAGVLFSQTSGDLTPAESRAVYALAAADSTELPDLRPAVDVIFRDDASAVQISESLRRLDLEIVSGPTSSGVYRLRPQQPQPVGSRAGNSVDEAPTFDAIAAAANLRAAELPVVQFAEPVP